MMALGSVTLSTLASIVIVGVGMVISGGAEIAHAFGSSRWSGFATWLILGLLYTASGVVILLNPTLAALVLTLMLGLGLVGAGVVRFLLAISMQGSRAWVLAAASGVITEAVGVLVIASWPTTSLFTLGIP